MWYYIAAAISGLLIGVGGRMVLKSKREPMIRRGALMVGSGIVLFVVAFLWIPV